MKAEIMFSVTAGPIMSFHQKCLAKIGCGQLSPLPLPEMGKYLFYSYR